MSVLNVKLGSTPVTTLSVVLDLVVCLHAEPVRDGSKINESTSETVERKSVLSVFLKAALMWAIAVATAEAIAHVTKPEKKTSPVLDAGWCMLMLVLPPKAGRMVRILW